MFLFQILAFNFLTRVFGPSGTAHFFYCNHMVLSLLPRVALVQEVLRYLRMFLSNKVKYTLWRGVHRVTTVQYESAKANKLLKALLLIFAEHNV